MNQPLESLQETIERLKAIIRDPNCRQMNKSTVVGFLSEILVREKLTAEGQTVIHKGNQAGYDLEVVNGPKIDVKGCTAKSHKEANCDFWGWALLSDTKKRKISFSHLVCVALDESLCVRCFYVIHFDHIEAFPPAIKRFNGVLHTLNVFHTNPAFKEGSAMAEIHRKCEEARLANKVVAVLGNESLSRAICGTHT